MKSRIALTLLALFASAAMAKGPQPTFGLNFVDVRGEAYLLRQGQTAAILITEDTVGKIVKEIKPASDSQISCGNGYCVIGLFNRDGKVSSFTGKLAEAAFYEKLLSRKSDPQSISDWAWFDDNGAKVYAYRDQCQTSPGGPTTGLVKITVHGKVAEQLYNFITTPARKGNRYGSKYKSDAGRYFECEKNPQHDHADISENGVPSGPPSFHEYSCEFALDKSGRLTEQKECHIYGGTFSAGGGGN